MLAKVLVNLYDIFTVTKQAGCIMKKLIYVFTIIATMLASTVTMASFCSTFYDFGAGEPGAGGILVSRTSSIASVKEIAANGMVISERKIIPTNGMVLVKSKNVLTPKVLVSVKYFVDLESGKMTVIETVTDATSKHVQHIATITYRANIQC